MKLSIINENPTNIVAKIKAGILEGDSDLREVIAKGLATMSDIASSIKKQRCLCLKHVDLGNTYLEQIIGNIISDVLPISEINTARKMFGLELMDQKELVSKKRSKKINKAKQKLRSQ